MGISVSITRVPLERAVDALSMRMSLSDFGVYMDYELLPRDENSSRRADLDPASPILDLWKSYILVLDVLTAEAHEHHSSLFITDEFENPFAWAGFGARLPGWRQDSLPLRYSLGSDLDTICDALDSLDERELERRVQRVLKLAPQYEPEGREPWVQDYMEKVVLAMRGFYRRARSAGEIVIHRMF